MSEASKIFKQLGGNQFAKMAGATNFHDGNHMLVFHIKDKKTKDGINKVIIKWEGENRYTMIFQKMPLRGFTVKDIRQVFSVELEKLLYIFEKNTGLLVR